MRTVAFEDGWNASALQQTKFQEQSAACAYPVLTLSPEIVAEIFVHFLPNYPERPPPSGIYSPILLCLVCRQWRDIAFSTPTLWRAIRIELNEPGSYQIIDWKLHILETWLSRSGGCPLSVCIQYHLNFSPLSSPYPHLSQFLRTLVSHCTRWEHIELIMPFEDLHLIQGEMPLLRHLVFGPTRLPPDPDEEGYAVLTLFDRAPQLTSVVLTNCFVPSCLRLPWAQIIRLEGRCLFEHECVEILREVDQLVHCALNVCDSSEPIPPALAILSLAHLSTLMLRVTGSSDVRHATILDNVTLPALRTLQVSETGPAEQLILSLKSLVSRSRCRLESLHVDRASLTETDYQEALPSIETITLGHK
ncbi:hypothetical protein FB451DRAFT_164037 [Mycena latifolia]|nr:hypothetical protein FB451DRAFT_164037 [Mycena latifolia]